MILLSVPKAHDHGLLLDCRLTDKLKALPVQLLSHHNVSVNKITKIQKYSKTQSWFEEIHCKIGRVPLYFLKSQLKIKFLFFSIVYELFRNMKKRPRLECSTFKNTFLLVTSSNITAPRNTCCQQIIY